MTDLAVVIPVFNGAAFLDQTLASLTAQSRLPDAVIVSDDGSSDESQATAEAWSNRLPLRVVGGSPNAGAGTARRRAITSTEAALIALLDCDDILLPDHLLLLERAYEEHGGLITSNALLWVPGAALASTDVASLRPVPPDDQLASLLRQNFVCVESMFARSDYENAGGFRSTEPVEDWDLWIRMASNGVHISGVRQPTVLFRLRSDSLTGFDDGVLGGEIRLLSSLVQELDDQRLVRVVEGSLRHRRSRAALQDAYRAARQGRSWAARRAALGALRGSVPTRLRGASMVLSPNRATRRRIQRRSPERLVGGERWAHGGGR